jgi:hypothetical protein
MPAARERRSWWASLLGVSLAAGAAEAQGPAVAVPPPPPGAVLLPAPPPAPPQPRPVGPIRRAVRHVGRTVHQDFIGDPNLFYEPPLGANLYETFGVMRAKAEPHLFTLYRSDFVVDSAVLTPTAAGRFARIAGNLGRYCGPVVIEPTPGNPALTESRREAVLAALGPVCGPERVVIGPTVAPGAMGTDAANFYQNLIIRDQQAGASFTLTPSASTAPGGGGGPR